MQECQRHFNAMEYDLAAAKCEAALKADATVVGAMRYLSVIHRGLGKKTADKAHYQQCIAWAEMQTSTVRQSRERIVHPPEWGGLATRPARYVWTISGHRQLTMAQGGCRIPDNG